MRTAREASVTAGLEALDVWIGDQLNTGLAGFVQRAQTACRTAAQRLVDVKAAGLAARLDALPGALLSRPEPLRPDFLLAELGRLHLISAAWRRLTFGSASTMVQSFARPMETTYSPRGTRSPVGSSSCRVSAMPAVSMIA